MRLVVRGPEVNDSVADRDCDQSVDEESHDSWRPRLFVILTFHRRTLYRGFARRRNIKDVSANQAGSFERSSRGNSVEGKRCPLKVRAINLWPR